jgi:hypothetical protein
VNRLYLGAVLVAALALSGCALPAAMALTYVTVGVAGGTLAVTSIHYLRQDDQAAAALKCKSP